MSSTQDFDTDRSLDIEAADFLENEIPSKLFEKISRHRKNIVTAQVERKTGKSWRTLKKRLRYGPEGPPEHISPDDICTGLIRIVEQDVEAVGHEGKYRARINVRDPESGASSPKFAPIRVEINEEGDISVFDADDFSDREHLHLLTGIIDKQSVRMDAVFERSLQLMDKNLEIVDKMGQQVENNGRSFQEMSRGLSSVVKAATGALEKAARMSTERQEEAAVVQLAKLDAETERQKLGAVAALLAKVGGPLGAQIAATFAGKKKEAAPAQGRTAAAIAAAQEEAAPQQDPNVWQSPPIGSPPPTGICKRLNGWIAKLEDHHKSGLEQIVGEKHYKGFLDAASSGEDEKTWEVLCSFKDDFDKRAEVNQAEIFGKLIQIQQLLGDDLGSEFGRLLPDANAG